jgi:hypothetical protein
MVIIYDSVLTEPPSSVHCFRDVTLYSNVFLNANNLLQCPKGTRSMYWRWIKKYGAHDFIEEILTSEEDQEGIYVGKNKKVNYKYINESNMSNLINELKRFYLRF